MGDIDAMKRGGRWCLRLRDGAKHGPGNHGHDGAKKECAADHHVTDVGRGASQKPQRHGQQQRDSRSLPEEMDQHPAEPLQP